MATLSGVRVNLFNENFLNETEQDANSVLTELDKGLRSAKLGIQCEAIVRFPRLFEKYPFPILINSSFLKLAEFFWNGSNLLRFWVLRVCQQSENHLDKILNIDQFVKRIFMVIHSNDPIARALTLRTLGAVSRVIPEKQQVHHAIRRALDSHDTVEVEAAIFASSQFAAQSKTFAISMCAKISDMIESLNIPVNMKLLLIPVLQHMHHDANTAAMVKSLCLDLLPKYPAAAFVIAILDSLTKLSSKTLIGVPDQVELLIYYLQDVRKSVRMQTLYSLYTLANSQCVHAWPKSAIGNLIAKAKDCPDGQPGRKDQSDAPEQNLYLKILYQLSACPLTCYIFIQEQYEAILDLCTECIWTENYRNCSQSLEILAALAVYCHSLSNEKSKEITELVNLQIESCLFLTIYETKYATEFKRILGCGIKLSSVDLNFGTEFVTTVAEFLDDKIEFPACNVEQLCGTLGALCSIFQLRKFTYIKFNPNAMDVDEPEPKKINPVLERLHIVLDKLNALLDSDVTNEKIKIVEILSAVTLQTLIGCFIPEEIIRCFERSCPKTNCWTQYRIARSASRYGQHFLAARIFSKISQSTSLDKLHFYLMGLSQMAQAECILNYGLKYDFMLEHYIECNPRLIDDNPDIKPMSTMQRLESAINLYWQALASMRASSSPTNPLTFQLEYLKLRAQFLQTLLSAVVVKNAQVIVPPPAIAGSLAQNSRDYLQKFGHVTNQLRKLVKALKSCEESYSKLYKSAFDSDPATLEFLEIMEYQCALFANIVETICYATPSEPPTFLMKGQYPETKYFILSCKKMEELLDHLPQEPANAKTISNRHLEVIISEIELIISRPLCMPRYFFQVLQSTQIKLSVSPQPRSAGEPVIVQSGSNLVIKVEGVIQHFGKKHSQFRRVDAVQLSLTSQLVTPRPAIETGGKPTNDTVTLTQTVKPQRDFLSGSFLLPISNGGQWQVTLETYAIDEEGITWWTGPKNSMVVRVLDDLSKAAPVAVQPGPSSRRF